MKQIQKGFTLIELVVVIVILGILAAVAIPKFVDLSGDAQTAALQGVAGAISSANTINFGARTITNNGGTGGGIAVTDCTMGQTILETGIPTGYTITAAAIASGTTTAACVLNGPTNGVANAAKTATFTMTGIS